MPEFGSPFSGLANNKKLTDEELVRAIRFMVAAEYEATQLYIQLAESTDNRLAVAVLKEIADEELVHAGEFLRLLHQLAPNEAKLYAQGAKEVDELIESVTLSAPPQSRNRLLSGASG
ncbi:MAG TPA: ferritin family protein [Armatimonadota bacterium]